MKKRLIVFWNTIRALWRTVSKPARALLIVTFLALLALPVFSKDHGFWLIMCGVLLGFGLISAYIVYLLVLKG